MKKILMVGAAALCVFAAGCTDLKPIQSQIDDLKSQVSKLSTSQDGVKAAADSAARAAQDAKTAAQQAASKADAAMSLGQDNKQRIDGLDEKIDEGQRRSQHQQQQVGAYPEAFTHADALRVLMAEYWPMARWRKPRPCRGFFICGPCDPPIVAKHSLDDDRALLMATRRSRRAIARLSPPSYLLRAAMTSDSVSGRPSIRTRCG